MDSECALRWITETESGSIRVLRDRLEWLARTRDRRSTHFGANKWIRDMRDLGYLEFDNGSDRWTVAEPALVRLPAVPELSFLTGARPLGLRAMIEECGPSLHEIAHHERNGRAIELPPTLVLQADSITDLVTTADRAGITYAGCAAARIASLLPDIQLRSEAAPPSSKADSVERLASVETGQFTPSRFEREGLYRYRAGWRWMYLFFHRDRWYHTALAAGTYHEASRRRKTIMSWRRDGRSGTGQGGLLTVHTAVLPPPLHTRCLIFCSGLPPVTAGAEVSFDNVPYTIAARVASSLGHDLVTGWQAGRDGNGGSLAR